MTILEFQKEIAAALNDVESLVQGGCKAFAEDTATVLNDINTQLASTGGVAIAVTTPALRKGGSEIPGSLAIEGSLDDAPGLREARLSLADFADWIECFSGHNLDSPFLFYIRLKRIMPI